MRFFALLAACSLPAAASIAIQDVTVVDVRAGRAHPHQTVVIDGERITAIGVPDATRIPANARLVNGSGKFLIPGLWDMHVHLWHQENQLPVFLAFGVTGVQDMGSDYGRVTAWRNEIESGKASGPHVVTSGPPVSSDDAVRGDRLPVIVARSANEARKAFDQLWDLNVDFVNVLPGLSRDAYFALAELARHWDLRLVGDMPSSISAHEALDARQLSLEHLAGVMRSVSTDVEAVEFFRRCATLSARVAPMLTWWRRMANLDERRKSDPRFKYVPASIRKLWAAQDQEDDPGASKDQVERVYRLVTLTKETQVEVLAGTDTGDPYTIPGATLHDELEQLVAAGLTPREALEAATIAPARFLGWDQDMGTVEVSKVADLVLLNGNPLADINNTRKIAGVFARGKYYSRRALDVILAGVK
jgi:hypothetical protein